MVGFLAALAINIGLSLLSLALRPRPKRPRPAAFDGPTADQGRAIPIVFGQFAIAPNVVWWGDARVTTSGQAEIPAYDANMLMTVCHGPITSLEDIQFGGKSIRMAPKMAAGGTTDYAAYISPTFPQPPLSIPGLPPPPPLDPDVPVTFTLDARRLFGGGPAEGGVAGEFRVYPGGLHQPPDELTVHSWSKIPFIAGLGLGTGRPGVAYVGLGARALPFSWGRP